MITVRTETNIFLDKNGKRSLDEVIDVAVRFNNSNSEELKELSFKVVPECGRQLMNPKDLDNYLRSAENYCSINRDVLEAERKGKTEEIKLVIRNLHHGRYDTAPRVYSFGIEDPIIDEENEK